ncbi:MAG: hypothetical protein H8E27_03335, partial [Verrucomicrobia subdivision 3 bacterium]|nr:hypothetical protein [Limisphaerales bacterium]
LSTGLADGPNHLLQLLKVYCGWEQQHSLRLETLDVEQLTQVALQSAPESILSELPELIADPAQEGMLADLLRAQAPTLNEGEARKAVKELREEGATEFPRATAGADQCPYWRTGS